MLYMYVLGLGLAICVLDSITVDHCNSLLCGALSAVVDDSINVIIVVIYFNWGADPFGPIFTKFGAAVGLDYVII